MINIKNIDLDLIKSGKQSNNIKYIASKNTRYVNSLYLIIDEISGHIEESNGNKCSTLTSFSEDKDVLKDYKKKWSNEIKRQISLITNASDNYDEEYIRIKVNSDNDLILKLR